MGRTKKVGSTGRFGARYGFKLRRIVKRIEDKKKAYHVCPRCGTKRVKWVSVGLWHCRFCDYKFAGGAFEPVSTGGKRADSTIRSIISRAEH